MRAAYGEWMRRWPFALAILGAGACASLEGLTGGSGEGEVDAGGIETSAVAEAATEAASPADSATPGCTSSTCVPVVLATSQGSPVELAIDAAFVYWRNSATGSVSRVERTAGALPTKVTTSASGPGLAVDSNAVYTIHFCNVLAVPLDGGATSSSASVCSLSHLAVSPSTLYTTNGGKLFKMSKTVADASVAGVGNSGNGTIGQVVETAGQIFYTFTPDTGAGQVAYYAVTGGLSSTFAPGQANPVALAADPAGVAWVTAGAPDAGTLGAVLTQRLTADTPHVVSKAGDSPVSTAVALDATYVYFATSGSPPAFTDATLFRALRDGSKAPEVLVTNEPAITAIAVDQTAIVWANRSRFEDGGAVASSGTIKMLAKP
jgi:hypothetical protein